MSTASLPWGALALLVAIALFAYAGMRFRRARADQLARSQARAAELLQTMRRARAERPAAVAETSSPAHGPPTQSASALPSASPGALVRKARLLSEPQRLLFLLLRAALADHIVMANIRIADLVEPTSAAAAGSGLQSRMHGLLQERADCVVCTNELVPLAAVVVYEAGIARVPDEQVKIEALRELGVKFLRFRADSLPRPAEMRALVLG